MNKEDLIKRFSEGDLPEPEDELWYAVLSSGFYGNPEEFCFEQKILALLNKRGFNAHIVGEKDSFGWITRGIAIDDTVMCLY